MDTTTLDFNTITLMVTIAGSWLTIVGLIIFQSSRLDTKVDNKFEKLGSDVTEVRERLARLEGHLMGPESFTSGPPSPDESAGGSGPTPTS